MKKLFNLMHSLSLSLSHTYTHEYINVSSDEAEN